MGHHKIDSLDKNRFASQDKLREDHSPAGNRCAAHRGPGKKFNHPDLARGTSLGKQARSEKKDPPLARRSDTLLQEIAEIRKKASELKKEKKGPYS